MSNLISKEKKLIFVVIIIFLTFGFILYSIEIFLLFYEKATVKQKFYETKQEYIKINDQENKIEIFPAYHPNLEYSEGDTMPLGTKPNSLNLLCNESGRWSKFYSDRFGFNNYDNLVPEKDIWDLENLKPDILLVGDSYLQGACVDQKHSISSQLIHLQNREHLMSWPNQGHELHKYLSTQIKIQLSDTDIINLSNSGTGSIAQLSMIAEYYYLINPKQIFWFYYEGNDLTDIKNEMKNKILSRSFIYGGSQQLPERLLNGFFDDFFENYKSRQMNFSRKNNFLNILKLNRLKNFLSVYKNIFIPMSKQDEYLFDLIAKRFKFYNKQFKSSLHFVYIPSYYRYSTTNLFGLEKFNKDKILNIIKENEIQIIDLEKKFISKNNYKDFYPNGQFGHFNEKGYFEVAKIVNQYINKN